MKTTRKIAPLVLVVSVAAAALIATTSATRAQPADQTDIFVAPPFGVGVITEAPINRTAQAVKAYRVTGTQLAEAGISMPDWPNGEPPMTMRILSSTTETPSGIETWTTILVYDANDFPFIEYRTKDAARVQRAAQLIATLENVK